MSLKTPVRPSPVEGVWAGTLTFAGGRLRLVFYIMRGPEGLEAIMKSPDQNDAIVPISSATLTRSELRLECVAIRAGFRGRLDKRGKTIRGMWTQGGSDLPLTLKWVANEDELRPERPQEPRPPYPYREEEVRYRSAGTEFDLAGTFTIPKGRGPFPAVLLIAGSGSLDRNETMNDHRPFLVLADTLARRGIAVLRADKRGVAESGGDHAIATTKDFAADARAGVAFLKKRAEVDKTRIGLVGHSEGGMIACMLAARTRDIAFIVLLAAPGVSGLEIARRQSLRRGVDLTDVFALLRKETDERRLRRELTKRFADQPEYSRRNSIQSCMSPWMRYFLRVKPAGYLRKVKCPLLALNGAKDIAVEADANLDAIRSALEAGNHRNFEIKKMPRLNHLFQTCETGSDTEYGQIEETISPTVLRTIVKWIRRRQL